MKNKPAIKHGDFLSKPRLKNRVSKEIIEQVFRSQRYTEDTGINNICHSMAILISWRLLNAKTIKR